MVGSGILLKASTLWLEVESCLILGSPDVIIITGHTQEELLIIILGAYSFFLNLNSGTLFGIERVTGQLRLSYPNIMFELGREGGFRDHHMFGYLVG